MKASVRRVVLVAAVCAACAAYAERAVAASEDYVKAAQSALQFTVSLTVENRQGSGFIIKSGDDYYVITSSAIVNQIAKVSVETADGTKYETELQGVSPGTGVAVLKMLEVKGALTAAKLGDSKKLDVGERVIAAGRPQGYGFCVTAGIVSGVFKATAADGTGIDFVQTDAAINAGQGGGPLVNLDGDVVGMCWMQGGGPEQPNFQGGPFGGNAPAGMQIGLGVVLPVSAIQESIRQIIRVGGVLMSVNDFGFNGLQDVNAATMQKLNLTKKEGALLVNVIRESPADKAGLKPNDVITEFNGKPVKNAEDLKALAQAVPAGAKVSVKFVGMRDDKPTEGTAELQLPEPEKGGISNDAPAEGGAVARAGCASAISDVSGGEGTPVVSSAADGGAYATPIGRVSPCVIMVDNGASAVLLPKSVAGNDSVRYLLTTEHRMPGRDKVRLTFYKGEGDERQAVEVDGDVVGADPKNDILVIRVSVSGAPDQIAIGNMKDAAYGTEVMAVGCGRNSAVLATAGIISAKNYQPREGLAGNFWATNARGIDGAALIDKTGKFVGLCTTAGNTFLKDGVSLFLPADTAISVARELIATGKTKSGYIGLESVQDLSLEERIKYKVAGGVTILKVAAGGPAEKAGLKDGQIVVKFGNSEVVSIEQLKTLVGAAEIGKKVSITVIDADGSRKSVEVEVAAKE